MIAPAIEFCVVKSPRQFDNVRSTNSTIRFRVRRRAERTEFDADWFHTSRELHPTAWEQIQIRWDIETREHRCKRASFGGGKACLIFAVRPDREDAWSTFLTNLLSKAESWLTWDGHCAFVASPKLEAAA